MLVGEVWIFYRVRLRARLVGGVRRESVCLSQVQIDPPSSVANATASPQGEAFLTLCEHGGRSKHGRYGKYHFVLWFAFATRPQATDGGRQHCSRSSSCRAVRKDSRKKASPWGKKTAGSLSRKRLMRGDIFALPRGMYLSHETERPVCRSACRSLTNLNHFYPVAERGDSRANTA